MCVLIFCTLDGLRYHLRDKNLAREVFRFLYVYSEMDIWMLIVEKNKEFTEFGSAVSPYH